MSEPWTTAEDALLSPDLSLKALAALLPRRTIPAIATRRSDLGISRSKPFSPKWTPAEDSLLLTMYPSRELETLLPHRSWNAIKSRAAVLGLLRKSRRFTAAELKVIKRIGDMSGARVVAKHLNCTEKQIYAARANHRMSPRKASRYPLPPLLADMRARAETIGVSPSSVAYAAGNPQILRVTKQGLVGIAALFRAAKILGGEIYAVWDD
jgi:hypothetical protein